MTTPAKSRCERRLCGITLALALYAFGCAEPDPKADAITVGLLLPFTGTSSATASNFERAVIYATDRVNRGGGVKGKPLNVLARDTHSEIDRSRRATQQLIDAGVLVVIGPESPDIASEIRPLLTEHRVAFLSPLVGAANDRAVDCTKPWFRLAPSARSLGEALAKELVAQGMTTAAVLYAAGTYNEALRDAVSGRFSELNGRVALEHELDPSAQSHADVVELAIAANVDAVVLATSPRTGALVVNEFHALSPKPPRWFLSPLLKTELLVQNVMPEALEGAIGVAPRVYDTSEDFPNAFAARWSNDGPLEGAYFYYDAIALLALALEKAQLSADGQLELEPLEAAIVDTAAPPGEAAGWNEIERALSQTRAGEDVYYSGLTGPMLLERCGSRRLGITTTWKVEAGRIVERAQP